jgi:outer membrane autotransporter protein
MRTGIQCEKQKFVQAARGSASVAALALALGLAATPMAQAQQLNQGGGGPAGGIAGGGGGRGGSGSDGTGRGGAGGSGAVVPGGSAQAGSTGTHPANGAAGGQAGTPNDIAAGGGGGGGGGERTSGPFTRAGSGGQGGGGGNVDATTGSLSLATGYLGSSGGNGVGGGGGSGGGGGGSGGLVLTGTSVNLTTDGFAVTGGVGGSSNTGGGILGAGGGGGAGLVLLDGGTVTVSGGSAIAGGAGGNQGSDGGGGGAGLFLYAGGTVANQAGSIRGGNGGGGLLAASVGGDAGAGVLSNLGAIVNQAVIAGGAGGNGTSLGGQGGIGVAAWGGGVDNSAAGTILGGAGGTLRNAGAFMRAGSGGAAVYFLDDQAAILTNAGTIEGGAAGATPFGDNAIGVGGVGIRGAATGNISIVNSGTITGGMDSRNATRSAAIALFGNGNRLELHAGSTINGNVVVSGGTGNALALGGSIDAVLDASQIGVTQQYRGFDVFEKIGASTWTLTGTGDQNWSIAGGALKGDTSSFAGNLTFVGGGGAGVVFDQAFDGSYGGTISGNGTVTKTGTGAMTLTGVSGSGGDFTGNLQLAGGALVLNGSFGDATGKTASLDVDNGANLGGSGTFFGNVSIADGGVVGPGTSPGTLTIAGNLTLRGGSLLHYELAQSGVVGGGINDLIVVGGDLTLDGTLNVTTLPSFGAGYYRLIDYAGGFTDNGLEIGTTPSGFTGTIQTGIAGQVNLLFNDGAQRVQYWDGADATGGSAAADGDGGAGIWRAGGTNWTAAAGFGINDKWAGQAGIFAGAAGGTVTVDGTQSFQLLRFDTDGYTLQGGGLAMTGGFSIVEVNATAARIDSTITGSAGLTKTGTGALTLGGANTYAGLTIVNGGTLSLAAGGTIAGAVQNDASFTNAGTVRGLVTNGGTLVSTGMLNGGLVNRGTASLAGQSNGTIVNTSGTITLTGALSGITRLDQTAVASLDLGGFALAVGTLDGAGSIALGGGTLAIGTSGSSSVFDGTITGGGAVTIAAGSFEGSGTIGAAVTVADGAHLIGAQGSTLSVDSLALGAGAQVDVTLGAPSAVALFDVAGNLTLDGTLNVAATPGFGAGVYRLFNYRGTLTDNGLELGTVTGASANGLSIQTGAGLVNLVDATGAVLTFWDGGVTALHNNGSVDGGSGVWSIRGTGWTNADGVMNSAMTPQPGFAVFQSNGGTVTIDNAAGQVSATGMQFAAQGYRVDGGDLALSGDRFVIRVGDGSAAGAGFTAEIGASLSGSATLVKSDLGTLVLSGSNNYTGGTIVEAGTLIGDTAALRGNIANNGSLVFDLVVDGTYAGTITGAGTTIKSGGGALTLTGANATDWQVTNGSLISTSTLFSGDLDLAQDARFVFDQAGEDIYAGTITGSGAIVVQGGGAIRFTGNGSGFRGTTSVGQGQMLAVNGTLGGTLNLAAGGRLQGSGTAGSGNIAGTIAPGNSIGTLSFTGNLTLASGSSYEVEADASGASDKIVVGGTATIGSNVGVTVLAVDGNYAANTNYTILTATGGVTGTFATVTSNLAFLTPTLGYANDAVTLNLRRNTMDFATVGQTANQIAVAPAVEALEMGNDVYDAVVALTAAEARDAFDQLAGSDYASVRGQLLEDSRFVRDAMLARGGTAGTTGLAIWGRALGSWGSMQGNANAQGYDRDLKGLLTGFDGSLGENFRAGVALGYGDTNLRTARAEHDVHAYHAGGYILGSFGAASFQLGGAYAWNDVHASRRVSFGTLGQTLAGDYAARTFQTFGEIALKGELGGVMLQPFAGVARVTLFDAELNEHGGSAALQGGDGNARVTYGTLGIRTRAKLALGDLGLRFTGSAALRHAFGDRVPTIDLAFAANRDFSIAGIAIERDSVAMDVGLEVDLSRAIAFGISYAGNYGDRSTDHGARASLGWRF